MLSHCSCEGKGTLSCGSTSSWVLLLCAAALASFPLALGFNLDTTQTLTKEGEKGSFFGFSLALHQQLSPISHSWILVGAPRARGLGALQGSRPGALYRCPITAEEYDCERVDIDGEVRPDRESKDNQWLGVTVRSQGIGGKVVTCAHLYELRQRVNQSSETRDPIGRCYVLSEDLTERDDLDGGEWKFCEGRPQSHEQFGFCQQGLAVSFTPDKNFILFGAPGTYNWKGELRVQLLNQSLLDLGFYDDGPYEVADEKQQDARLIPVPFHSYLGLLFMASPVEDALVYKTLEPLYRPTTFEDVAQNSYLGFSVDSAKDVLSRGHLTFVAGAPRANHTGAVVLLRKDNVYRLVPQHILWGEELASSFGYSVATADLNNDGWTDIIVGAPNFFDRKAEIGGAVYVYLNPASHWHQARPIRLNGTHDSMFGLAVTSVGDLDQDGYGDIAVGAPFDGDGKVFIYRGSSSGIDTKTSQVLDGVGVGVKHFGYSISGGLDIDGNSYPDLAVGSLDDQVVLYRSRPVIHLRRDISIEPQNIDLENRNCKGRDGVCVEVKACFTYTARPTSYSPYITLEVRFEADTERRKLNLPHRISFLGRTASELEYQRSEEVELRGQSQPACKVATFQLQENLRDKLRPISLAITHSIKRARHLGHVAPKHLGPLSPVLSASISSTLHTEVNFLREGCGDDRICQSNLQLSYRFGTRPVNSDLFTPLPIDEDGVPVFSLSDQRSIALEVLVTNMPSDPQRPHEDGDDAHAAQLLVTLPDTLSYSGFRGQQVVCQTNQNGSQAECELGNPLKRDSKLKFYIILSTSGITIETTALSVDLLLVTISEQSDLAPVRAHAKVVIELPLSISGVARPHQLFFSGTVKGESAMVTLDDVGSPVEFEFTVTNPGQFLQTLGSAFLNIMWPHELANGKWLLYPTDVHFQGHPNTHCTPATLNPLSLTDSHPRHHHEHHQDHHHHHDDLRQDTHHTNPSRRNVRSHQEEDNQDMVKDTVARSTPAVAASERRKSLQLDCLLGSARCLLLQCPLHSISGSAVLSVQARLWNATFLEEFSSVSALELLVRANITVKSSIKHLVLRDAASQVSVMIYPEHGVADQHGIPWWIILIAVLAGILVLALLVCILWKCGFFQRAQYKDTVPQYHAIKIPREDRPQFQNEKTGTLRKKDWATHWSDGTS
ncbi:integrin alpha-7 [Scleropages formosus]|uniref:integrin alpha-7 n=1 Tax=Scleropages formosus TaxID=113540 RepID=UPI000878A774|nr:integrin alpha-7-like [Scleropages formosus]